MARYDWPREFTKSPDLLAQRAERTAARREVGTPPALLGDLAALNDVIQTNFDPDRIWMPLGPSILTNGQATGNPVVSGRARAIKVSPNGQRVYVASANGGVWYSADAGASWVPVGAWGLLATTERSNLSLTIGEMDVQFGVTGGNDDPDKDVVYVGTGEARPVLLATPGGKSAGIGVLRLEGTITAAVAAPGTNPWQREARNLTGAGIFRLTHDPAAALSFGAAGANTLVAATSNGLWARSGGFVEGADWTRVNLTPSAFDADDGPYCPDVVWNDKGLWVIVAGGRAEDGLWRSTNGIAGPFAQITLPNLEAGNRLSLGPARHATDRMYVLGKSPPAVAGTRGYAHLWLVDLSHSTAAAREVANFPVGLFTADAKRVGANLVIDKDQADYDQAIAVTQSAGKDIVIVGGSLKSSGGGWNASLFRLTVTGTAGANDLTTDFVPANQTGGAADASYIGSGIHPDVHGVTLNGGDIWVACDGGVFRRNAAGLVRALNAGLATSEPGFVASHPTLDGPMICGTQDNGAIQRVGDTVWSLRAKGDGGGCLYHPTKPHQLVLQYVRANWKFQPAATPLGPVLRRVGVTNASEDTENLAASFYSQAAAARTSNVDQARIFTGTDRIWYSANWDIPANPMTWVTIPSRTDPWSAVNAAYNSGQDALKEGGSPDHVIAIDILREGDLANNFDGQAILVLCQRTVRIFRFVAATSAWTPLADSIVSDPSGANRRKAKKRAADIPNPFLTYLPRKPDGVWTDIAVHRTGVAGQETFYVTTTGAAKVKEDGSLEGDAHYDTCWWYNGNGRWYPTGLRNTPLDPAAGTGGSPAAAHSVVVDPVASGIVYVGNRIGVWEGRIDESGPHPTWTWKPAMEGLPQALVEDLHVFNSADGTYLRAALVSRGMWERDVSAVAFSVGRTFIRSVSWDTGRSELPAAPRDPVSNDPLDYHSSPDIVVLPAGPRPWDPGMPHEADLTAAVQPSPLARAVHSAWIMVHHRHTTPVPGASMNIDVFLQRGAPSGAISGIAITAQWRQAVLASVAGNAAAAGFPAGLSHVGTFHPAAPVDAANPRAVMVPLDLGFPIQGPGPDDYVAVIVVVTSPGNGLSVPSLAPGDLETIVRRSAQVAVRKIRRL
ncbi:hypothetical protein GVY41_01305 [Frigidibacter albus]|uniref:Uncharacterized protein n=1 Tax=Frigidibacter albus TaxID=1465486 RepID=A0A6L8VER3_9RHOB|nr:hypothetical protein [Frigidibacter albus]MZQ87730.1 hypothetical protein [Frigidibacter albus]NBE29636.1 hypothetical protein [Frigidibacter albus]GGH43654.1 hypothetical protein GCM10011341_02470 [Frigidibacter albus]